MPFDFRYSAESLTKLKTHRGFDRAKIVDQIEQVLGVNPTFVSKARVKLLRQPAPTQYRLRVDDFRVYYNVNVEENVVSIVRILSKQESLAYLEENHDDSNGR